MRILLINGSEQDFFSFEEISRNANHDLMQAEFSDLQLKKSLTVKPDILVIGSQVKLQETNQMVKQMRNWAGQNQYLPILMLMHKEDLLDDVLTLGIDDFLSHPYSRPILSNKLSSLSRLAKLEETLLLYQTHQLREKEVAQSVFDKISHFGCLDDVAIQYSLSTQAVFNGETILAARKPSGDLCVMMNAFAGQGLPATIGTVPVAEIFYTLVSKGFSLANILTEINKKLHAILPVGVFCRACAAELNMFEGVISVWNAGFPESMILTNNHEWHFIQNSLNIPLGILPTEKFKLNIQVEKIKDEDRFFIFSDDILKLKNQQGEIFGMERIKKLLDSLSDKNELFQAIHQSAWEFVGEDTLYDPLTIVEMRALSPIGGTKISKESFTGMLTRCMRDWRFSLELHPLTLREFDPLPLLLQILMESPELEAHKGAIYTILAELYSNALDHGILQLDSAMKATPQGFVEYYAEREKMLKTLTHGFVRFNFKHIPTEQGGKLTIRVEDSGEGFHFQDLLNKEFKREGYSGRGIPLIRSLCETFQYFDNGNTVEAVFVWDV